LNDGGYNSTNKENDPNSIHQKNDSSTIVGTTGIWAQTYFLDSWSWPFDGSISTTTIF
jgi:hypothetical protein